MKKLTLLFTLFFANYFLNFAQNNTQIEEEIELTCYGEGTSEAEIAFEEIKTKLDEKSFTDVKLLKIDFLNIEANKFLSKTCKDYLKRYIKKNYLNDVFAPQETPIAIKNLEKILLTEKWLLPEAQAYLSELNEKNFLNEIKNKEFSTLEQAKLFHDKIQTHTKLNLQSKKKCTDLLAEKTINNLCGNNLSFHQIKKFSLGLSKHKWLQAYGNKILAAKLSFSLQDTLVKLNFNSFDEGKKFVNELSTSLAHLQNEKNSLLKFVKNKILADMLGSPAENTKIDFLQSYLQKPEGAWLIEDGRNYIAELANDKDGFIKKVALNAEGKKAHLYEIRREIDNPSEMQNLQAFTNSVKAEEGYNFLLYELHGEGESLVNEKIYHTFITWDSISVHSFEISFYMRQAINGYSWKPLKTDFVKLRFEKNAEVFLVKESGNIINFKSQNENINWSKIKIKPENCGKHEALKIATQYFVIAYRGLFK